MEFVAKDMHDIPNTCQPEALEHEVCLLQSAAVWHVPAIGFVSRQGEYPLHGGDYVPVIAPAC